MHGALGAVENRKQEHYLWSLQMQEIVLEKSQAGDSPAFSSSNKIQANKPSLCAQESNLGLLWGGLKLILWCKSYRFNNNGNRNKSPNHINTAGTEHSTTSLKTQNLSHLVYNHRNCWLYFTDALIHGGNKCYENLVGNGSFCVKSIEPLAGEQNEIEKQRYKNTAWNDCKATSYLFLCLSLAPHSQAFCHEWLHIVEWFRLIHWVKYPPATPSCVAENKYEPTIFSRLQIQQTPSFFFRFFFFSLLSLDQITVRFW